MPEAPITNIFSRIAFRLAGARLQKPHCAICGIAIALLALAPASGDVVRYKDCVVDTEIFWSLPKCALESRDGHLYVAQRYLRLFFPVEEGHLAAIQIPGRGWSYFDKHGLIVVENVATMDNGASKFHHGLVRVVNRGKWGLANSHGVMIVRLRYDGILEYEDDKGWLVCTGCRDVAYGSGEYHGFEGGEWFWLDKRGHVTGKARDPNPNTAK